MRRAMTWIFCGLSSAVAAAACGEAPDTRGLDEPVAAQSDGVSECTLTSCSSAECKACRSRGFGTATDCSRKRQKATVRDAYLRFRYTGIDEGHDHASSLLRSDDKFGSNICNVSKGTCSKKDEGCLGVPFPVCSGKGSFACRAGESCVGDWSVPWAGIKVGDFSSKLSKLVYAPYAPYDCDCNHGYSGAKGWIALNFESGVFTGATMNAGSGEGKLAAKGARADVEVESFIECIEYGGTCEYEDGCEWGLEDPFLGSIDHRVTDRRTISLGNPTYL